METQLLPVLANLGVAGFALYVMWRKDQAATIERTAFLKEITNREEAFRTLEREVRDRIFTQLAKNTEALERVLKHFKE